MPSQGRKGEKWKSFILSFHYGNTYIKNRVDSAPPSTFQPTWPVAASGRTALSWGSFSVRGWSCAGSFMLVCIFTPPDWLFKRLSEPPQMKISYCLHDWEPALADASLFTSSSSLRSPRSSFFAPEQSLPPSFAPGSSVTVDEQQ